MLELLAMIMSTPQRPNVISSGKSQYFLLFFRNRHDAAAMLICRVILRSNSYVAEASEISPPSGHKATQSLTGRANPDPFHLLQSPSEAYFDFARADAKIC